MREGKKVSKQEAAEQDARVICDLDAVEAELDRLVKNEDVEEAANALDRIARRLLATTRHYIQLAGGRNA